MESVAKAVDSLAEHQLMAMVEPFISGRDESGRIRNDLSTEAVIRSATVAAGLGSTSAHTWLKMPVIDDMEAVLASTTLPVLLLGGEVGADQDAQFAAWSKALASPMVKGMVVGRSLLFPPDGNVEAAVDATVEMMCREPGRYVQGRRRSRRSPSRSPPSRLAGTTAVCGSWSSHLARARRSTPRTPSTSSCRSADQLT